MSRIPKYPFFVFWEFWNSRKNKISDFSGVTWKCNYYFFCLNKHVCVFWYCLELFARWKPTTSTTVDFNHVHNALKILILQFWFYKFEFLSQISIFESNFNFWVKFQFLSQISIFESNFNFRVKFHFEGQISIFESNFILRVKFQFLSQISFSESNYLI